MLSKEVESRVDIPFKPILSIARNEGALPDYTARDGWGFINIDGREHQLNGCAFLFPPRLRA